LSIDFFEFIQISLPEFFGQRFNLEEISPPVNILIRYFKGNADWWFLWPGFPVNIVMNQIGNKFIATLVGQPIEESTEESISIRDYDDKSPTTPKPNKKIKPKREQRLEIVSQDKLKAWLEVNLGK
jgi:hypothetical protein